MYIPEDKILHILIGSFIYVVLKANKQKDFKIFILIFILSFFKEIWDMFTPGRNVEALDIICSIYPAVLLSFIIRITCHK